MRRPIERTFRHRSERAEGRRHARRLWGAVGLSAFVLSVLTTDLGQANVPIHTGPLPGAALHHWTARLEGPHGFVDFCRRSPGDCRTVASRVPADPDGRVGWTPEVSRLLARVNGAVNHGMKAVAEDPDGPDIWQADTPEGDCEDFALTKRRRLIEQGWPSSAVVMATAYIPTGDYHAVLIARTSGGDYVLDNLNDAVAPWNTLGYRFVKLQSEADPMVWHAALPQ